MPDFPYHNQGNPHACGAACLMMMLESRGLSLAGLRQSVLMTETRNASAILADSYASSPEALVTVANRKLSGAAVTALPRVQYRIFPHWINPLVPAATVSATDSECIAAIRAGLGTGAPVFLLANGGAHWILVYKRLRMYYVRWPMLGPSRAWLDAHGAPECTVCTEGFEDRRSRGALLNVLQEVVPAYEKPPGFMGQRILLVPSLVAGQHGPAGPPGPEGPAGPPPNGDPPPQVPPPPPPLLAQDDEDFDPRPARLPLTAESAREFVQEQLPAFVDTFEEHGKLIPHATAGPAVMVNYLKEDSLRDDPVRDYFLVPVVARGTKLPHFLAQVGVAKGELSISSIRAAVPDHAPWVFAEPGEDKPFPPGWSFTRRLVWKPCEQSLTPLQPFFEVRNASGAIGFLDLHGNVHPKLTRANWQPPQNFLRRLFRWIFRLKIFCWFLVFVGIAFAAWLYFEPEPSPKIRKNDNRPGGRLNVKIPFPKPPIPAVEPPPGDPK